MNANELAEQLDEYAGNSGYSHNDYADSMSQAATMLRQQQAEIERLIMLCDCMTTESNRKGNEIEALKAKLAYMFEQEINSVAFEMVNKAILRKASEK